MSDVILFKEDIDRLNGILQHLVHETKVLSAILVNKDTRLLASQGTLALFDMSALAALIVGSFASTQGIAGLIGEKEFSMMSHCGKSKNLLIMLVDDDTICAAIFDRNVSLSTVSSSIAKHIEELRAALLAIKHNMDVAFQGPIAMPSLSLSQDDVEKGIDNFFEAPASQDQAAVPAAARHDLPETAVKKPPEKQFTEKKPAGRPEVRPPEVRPEVPSPQETRQLEFAVALSRDEEKAGPDKFKASELDKSLSSNTTAPSPYKNIPPPSNTEYLYFTSMNFLKNKAKQRLSRNKKNNEKNIISRFFNRGRPV